MNANFRHFKKNKIICIVIFLFLFAKILALFIYKTVWWDSAAYIGMGKFIFSFGKSGLWENSRPIIWPIILGFLWKIGLNQILFGRIIEIIFGALYILLTYLIGKKLFSQKVALFASILIALSPTFFFLNGIMLTEIVSTFFSLLAIYLLIKNKHFASGLFFGIAFITRFLQLFAFIGIISALIYNKKDTKTYRRIFLGFILAVLPYPITNKIFYHNAFFPFLQQVFLTSNSGWLNHRPISYYFIELFKDNFLYLLFVIGIIMAIRKPNSRLISFPFLILFSFFNLIKQKEMRFLIILLPYMCLFISYSIVYFMKFKKFRRIATALILVLFVISAIKISRDLASESGKINQYAGLQNGLEEAKGNIWVSNPVIAAYSDKKITRLIYYPVFGQNFEELIEESKNADFIFVDTCDLGCKPFDVKCENNKREMILHFQQKLRMIYSSKPNSCEQFAFKKQ